MKAEPSAEVARAGFIRRARPHLGTLVEIGVASACQASRVCHASSACRESSACHGSSPGRACNADAAIAAAFARIVQIESALSRFDPRSTVGCFNAATKGAAIALDEDARVVLAAADELRAASGGIFDISVGTGCDDWACEGKVLRKRSDEVRLDLGGIAKGHAVDVAVAALQEAGVAAGWVNAGGDLRVFGPLALPIDLRDEQIGGVRRFATIEEGAFATSWIVAAKPSLELPGRTDRSGRHASVAAERCLWADALTKVVALTGDPEHALVAAHGARAWLH